jgi:hypothetical protein
MKYLMPLVVLAVACAARAGDEPKGTVVELDKLKSQAPGDWKSEKPSNNLRSHQFKLPHVKGDPEDAELAILPDAKPPAEEAIKRWQDMFLPPEGEKIEDVSKIEKFMVGKVKVTYLDLHGTYIKLPRPLAPKKDGKPLPGYRMLAVFFDGPGGAHTIRLIGPETTVEEHKAAFDKWLKNFK